MTTITQEVIKQIKTEMEKRTNKFRFCNVIVLDEMPSDEVYIAASPKQIIKIVNLGNVSPGK